jgi:hypothetical protein
MKGAPHLYNKADLLKLKDSKPVAVTAHSHEAIIPVVYTGLVNDFLKKKGIKLPLTHHQLAEMKREAHAIHPEEKEPGHARGTKAVAKAKGKQTVAQAVNQKVVIHLGNKTKPRKRGGRRPPPRPLQDGLSPNLPPPPNPPPSLNVLRPSHFANIRPFVEASYIANTPFFNLQKELNERNEKEKATEAKYKKELEEKESSIKDLEKRLKEDREEKKPINTPEVPIRSPDFDEKERPPIPEKDQEHFPHPHSETEDEKEGTVDEYNIHVHEMQQETRIYIDKSKEYVDYVSSLKVDRTEDQLLHKRELEVELKKLYEQLKLTRDILKSYQDYPFYRKEYTKLPKKQTKIT